MEAVKYYTDKGENIKAFSIVDQYHVTNEKAILYLKGLSSINSHLYPLAFDYLKRCKGYKKADEKYRSLAYTLGCKEMRNGNLNEAYAYFSKIDSAYQDTAKRQAICQKYMKYCKRWKTALSHSTDLYFILKLQTMENPKCIILSMSTMKRGYPYQKITRHLGTMVFVKNHLILPREYYEKKLIQAKKTLINARWKIRIPVKFNLKSNNDIAQ